MSQDGPAAPADPGAHPAAVVLAPDLIAAALTDDVSGRVLELWSEGRIRPAISRGLLLRYLRVLRRLGLPEELVRRWAWWFSAPDKCLQVDSEEPTAVTGWALCQAAARAGAASCIVHSGKTTSPPAAQPPPSVRCLTAADFAGSLRTLVSNTKEGSRPRTG